MMPKRTNLKRCSNLALAIRENVELKRFNSLQLPSSARWFCEISSTEALLEALEYAHRMSIPVIAIGGGTNLVLLSDLEALVLRPAIKGIKVDGNLVTAGAGESWHGFVEHCLNLQRYGLENLALIPGTVGAAPVQNIGAYGVELDQFVERVVAVHTGTLQSRVFSRDDCRFDYRDSRFKAEQDWIITEVSFRLRESEMPVADYPGIRAWLDEQGLKVSSRNVFRAVTSIRLAKLPDPENTPNAGSFFKNPLVSTAEAERLAARFPGIPVFPAAEEVALQKLSAAWLIDHAGLKGRSAGRFSVSEQHALVLVNDGGGSAANLLELIALIRETVHDHFGIQLEPEPRFYP